MATQRKSRILPSQVVLATVDHDLGIVPGDAAEAHARDQANTLRTTVYIRDEVTDRVLRTVRPQR